VIIYSTELGTCRFVVLVVSMVCLLARRCIYLSWLVKWRQLGATAMQCVLARAELRIIQYTPVYTVPPVLPVLPATTVCIYNV